MPIELIQKTKKDNGAAPIRQPSTAKTGTVIGKGILAHNPRLAAQGQLIDIVKNSTRVAAQRQLVNLVMDSPRMVRQRAQIDAARPATPRWKVDATAEPRETPSNVVADLPAQRQVAPTPNRTGLPNRLKAGIEQLSGMNFDHVRVHFNSKLPAQLDAHGYAQGSAIHLAPGQEQHLPHEAWHVVQQAQGRVRPTMRIDGTAVNGDRGLEHEADRMGRQAAIGPGIHSNSNIAAASKQWATPTRQRSGSTGQLAVQRFAITTPVINPATMKTNIQEALTSGAAKSGGLPAIGSQSNVDLLYPLFGNPLENAYAVLAGAVGPSKDRQMNWMRNMLNRVERGAQELASDVAHWTGENFLEEPGIKNLVVLSAHLTGSDIHERGLGVTKLDYQFLDSAHKTQHHAVMLKPDDRSFERKLLGSSTNSVAQKLNSKAELGADGIEIVPMKTSKEHGTVASYVERSFAKWWQPMLRRIKGADPVAETVAFGLLAGLWDLHVENVIQKNGKPVLIDAEVGMQPQVYAKQHDGKSAHMRNSGLSTPAHQLIDEQLKNPHGKKPSRLLDWARKNPKELATILRNGIGNSRARIVPVNTKDWVHNKDIYLIAHLSHDIHSENHKTFALKESIKILTTGLNDHARGKPSSDFKNEKKLIKGNFLSNTIPEYYYQPETGNVTHGNIVIWHGDTLKKSLQILASRLL